MADQPPPMVPAHELCRLIGRGSYGEVWLARNVMGAWRAVKVVRRSAFSDERPLEREFNGIRRYEPLSRSGEGLVPVLQVGRDPDGFHYVMELADDAAGAPGELRPDSYRPRTLRDDLQRLGRLPVADCLEVGLALAQGLTRLHRHGLVHRDLKPSNVIFLHGQARLADLGLVGGVDESKSYVGTLGYIPPEGPGTRGGDVFALGRVLYEAATGLAPEEFPHPPADWLRADAPADALELHEIILRACEPDPARRYAGCEPLIADLATLRSGRSVRQSRRLERRLKWARRLTVAAMLAGLLGLAVAWLARQRAETERENAGRAEALRQRAERAEQAARGRLAEAQLARAGLERRSGRPGQRFHALALLAEAARGGADPVALRSETIAARSLADWRPVTERSLPRVPGHREAVDATFTRFTEADPDGGVTVRRWPDGSAVCRLAGARAEGLVLWPFSAEGTRVAGRTGNRVEVWSATDGDRVFAATIPGASSVDLTPDGRSVVVRRDDGSLEWRELASGQEMGGFHPGFVDGDFALSPDAGRVVLWSPGQCLFHLFAAAGSRLQSYQLPPPACPRQIVWEPEGQSLLVAGDDFAVYRVRPGAGERAVRLLGHQAEVATAAALPGEALAVTTAWDDSTRLWDLRSGQTLLQDRGGALELRWATPGKLGLLTDETAGHRLREYAVVLPAGFRRLDEPVPPRALDAHKGVWDVAFLASGRVLATASYDGVRLWPLAGGEPTLIPLGTTRWVRPAGTGEELWASTGQQVVRLGLKWEPDRGVLRVASPLSAGAVGWQLPLADGPGTGPWTVEGNRIRPADGDGGADVTLPFAADRLLVSPNGDRWLAGHYLRGEFAVVDRAKGRVVRRSNGRWAAADFADDGDELLVAAGELRREDAVEGSVRWRRAAPADGGWTGPLAVSRSQRLAAVVAAGDRIVLVDTASGAPLAELETRGHAPISALAFAPDGRFLAAGTQRHSVFVWDLAEHRRALRELQLDWSGPCPEPAVVAPVTILRSDAPTALSTRPGPVPLAGFETHTLDNFGSGSPENGFGNHPPRLVLADGIRLESTGVIQLGGRALPTLPLRVAGIPVHRHGRRLHFLHATAWEGPPTGEVGRYRVRWAGGAEAVIPLRHGEELRDWWLPADDTGTPRPAWTGSNAVAAARGRRTALYHLAWDNPHPEREIATLDFETDGAGRLPFLVALTID